MVAEQGIRSTAVPEAVRDVELSRDAATAAVGTDAPDARELRGIPSTGKHPNDAAGNGHRCPTNAADDSSSSTADATGRHAYDVRPVGSCSSQCENAGSFAWDHRHRRRTDGAARRSFMEELPDNHGAYHLVLRTAATAADRSSIRP